MKIDTEIYLLRTKKLTKNGMEFWFPYWFLIYFISYVFRGDFDLQSLVLVLTNTEVANCMALIAISRGIRFKGSGHCGPGPGVLACLIEN